MSTGPADLRHRLDQWTRERLSRPLAVGLTIETAAISAIRHDAARAVITDMRADLGLDPIQPLEKPATIRRGGV